MTPEERREIRSDLDIADNLLRLCWDNFKATEPTFVLRDLIVIEFDKIRHEAEQAAYERAAKVADKIEREERERRDETQDDDFASSAESRRVTAAYIAQSIRDLGKQKA